jgi:hypothetical protein
LITSFHIRLPSAGDGGADIFLSSSYPMEAPATIGANAMFAAENL